MAAPDTVGEPHRRLTRPDGPLARAAAALFLPLNREAAMLVSRERLRSHPVWTDPPLDTGGLPVLVIGGMASSPVVLAPMQDWLHRLGARPVLAPVQYGIGCGERAVRSVMGALDRLSDAAGDQVLLIAHSRGGQFARSAAVRHPGLVRGLITLGSPLNRLLAVHPVIKAHVVVLGFAGTLGLPGLLRAGCIWGTCCRRLRADLVGPFPHTVPFVSIYSRSDGVVDWRASLDPAARNIEVDSTHGGLITDPEVFVVVAEQLGAMRTRPALPVSLAA
jgi:triacylglycerol lipase